MGAFALLWVGAIAFSTARNLRSPTPGSVFIGKGADALTALSGLFAMGQSIAEPVRTPPIEKAPAPSDEVVHRGDAFGVGTQPVDVPYTPAAPVGEIDWLQTAALGGFGVVLLTVGVLFLLAVRAGKRLKAAT